MNGAELSRSAKSNSLSRVRPSLFFRWILWFGTWGAVALPVLSHCGYSFWEFEYLSVALGTLLIALTVAAAPAPRWLDATLLIGACVSNAALYFGATLMSSAATQLCTALALLLLALLSLRRDALALRLVGIVGLAQIASALITTPPRVIIAEGTGIAALPEHKTPSVLHLVLDEHTGLSTIPNTPECAELKNRILELYVSRGFTVFTQAYSEHVNTRLSFAFFLNPLTPPEYNLEPIEGTKSSDRVKESWLFRQIAKSRTIDATFCSELDLNKAIQTSGAHYISRKYSHYAVLGQALAATQAPLHTRLHLLLWNVLTWFKSSSQSSPLTSWLTPLSKLPCIAHHSPDATAIAVLSATELSAFAKRLSKECNPGTYYFGHFLTTHHSFCFDEHGRVYPSGKWRGAYPFAKTREEQSELYALHLKQALFTDKQVAELADLLDRKFSRSGHAIMIHSDHGSRITMPVGTNGQSNMEWNRQLQNCFLAVRIPGVPGGVVHHPTPMDRVVTKFVKNDFASLDLDSIIQTPGNPFAAP